jgi:hypothetical protein
MNRLRKKSANRGNVSPQRLKPHLFSTTYVRANARCGEAARTLRETEFFRSLFSRAAKSLNRAGLFSPCTILPAKEI